MSVKFTFTPDELEQNKRIYAEENDGPLSNEDSELLKKLCERYEQQLKEAQRQQHRKQTEVLPEIGRRKQ